MYPDVSFPPFIAHVTLVFKPTIHIWHLVQRLYDAALLRVVQSQGGYVTIVK
jgi:hypothetical protein